MTRYEISLDAHTIAGLKPRAPGRVGASRRARSRQRNATLRALLQFLARDDALFDQQRREARQRPLVIARRHVMARLHALDGMAILVHVEQAAPHREGVQ